MDLCIQDKSKKWSRIWKIFGDLGGRGGVKFVDKFLDL